MSALFKMSTQDFIALLFVFPKQLQVFYSVPVLYWQQASRRIVTGEGTPLSAGQIGGGWRGQGRCLVPVVV